MGKTWKMCELSDDCYNFEFISIGMILLVLARKLTNLPAGRQELLKSKGGFWDRASANPFRF